MASITRRVNREGRVSYRARVRVTGYPVQSATFRRLNRAKQWAGRTEAAVREGRYFRASQAEKYTLSELLDRYIEEVLPGKPASFGIQQSQLRAWEALLGSYSLAQLTPELIAEARRSLARERTSRGTAYRPTNRPRSGGCDSPS